VWAQDEGTVQHMDPGTLVFALAVLAAAIWLIKPYIDWRRALARPLESHIARTSFQFMPGALAPPSWKAPEVMLSVVVPAFNEEDRIPLMLSEAFAYLEARAAANPLGFSYEVIVVDDGSVDGTYGAALGTWCRQPNPRHGELRVLQLVANRGKGFATRLGMMAARGRLLLMADADGATSIRDLERLEWALSEGRYDEDGGPQLAFGSRYHLKEEVSAAGRSVLRGHVMAVLQLLAWLCVGGPVYDTQCGFKLFRAGVGKALFSSLHLHGWAFDVELVILARLFGQRIAEVPVTWVEMPGSKFGFVAGTLCMIRDFFLLQVFYLLRIWRPVSLA